MPDAAESMNPPDDPRPERSHTKPTEPHASNPDLMPVFRAAARRHLLINSLDVTQGQYLDYARVTIPQVLDAFSAVHEAGRKMGLAQALGVAHIVHDPSLDRFPWQVHRTDGHCDLFTSDFTAHVRIRSMYAATDDASFSIRPDEAPAALFEAILTRRGVERRR